MIAAPQQDKFWTIQNPCLIALIYLALCFATFGNSLHNDFLMDDHPMLIGNRSIDTQSFLQADIHNLGDTVYFRPVTHFLNYITFGLFGHNPLGYHLFNLSLFCLCLFSFHLLFYLLFKNHGLCLLTVILFCVHPINGILINYKNATGYSFLALAMNFSLINYLKEPEDYPSRFNVIRGTLWLTMALMCHEVAIGLPLYLGIALYTAKSFPIKKIFQKCLPSIGLIVLFLIFRFSFVNQGQGIFQNIRLFHLGLIEYIASFAKLVGWYSTKLLTLNGIVLIWETPLIREHTLSRAFPFIGIVITCLAFAIRFKRSCFSFALSWLMVGFIPVTLACFSRPNLGFIIEPHWLAYSSIGFFLLIGLALLRLKHHINNKLWALLVISLIAFNLTHSWRYNYLWGNQKRYCRYWLTIMPYNFMPNFWLGHSLIEEGNYKKAKKTYRILSKKVNKSFETYGNLGIIDYRLDNLDDALSYFENSLALNDNNADTYYYMGDIYLQKGDLKKAEQSLKKCLILDSHFLAAKRKLADVFQKQNQTNAATQMYLEVKELEKMLDNY